MANGLTRREMLRKTALGSLGFWAARKSLWASSSSPNEKLNIAIVGVAGRGRANTDSVAGENIVALCDVDDNYLRVAAKRFPNAKKYYDFRRMLDEMEKEIDAVVVSTPDHTHAPPSVMAMKMGKHCYCEKPLTHSVYEARTAAKVAAEKKVVTQMGTQHHATSSHRRIVELIQSGAIGPVRECHVWIGGNRGGGERPTNTPPVPPHLKWDLWLGPAPYRPYHPAYVPYQWRFWWDFGTGETGNNGVHIMDVPFWALRLRHPTTVEAEGPPVHPETSPRWMHVRYTFPARGDLTPLPLDFYHAKDGPPRPRPTQFAPLGIRRPVHRPERDAPCHLRRVEALSRIEIRRFQTSGAHDPGFDRPPQGVARRLQDRQPHHLPFRLLRRLNRGGSVGERGVSRRREAPVGPGELEGDQLPRG